MKSVPAITQIIYYLAIVFFLIAVVAAIYLGFGLSMAKVPWIFVLASFTPTLAAVLVTRKLDGAKGLRELFGRWKVEKFDLRWLLISLSPFFVVLLGILIHHILLGGDWQGIKPLSALEWFGLFVAALVIGSLGEETGWRGFMLPRLLEKMGALSASLILGLAWAAFHLPLWFIKDSGYTMPLWMFTIIILSVTCLITVAFNISKGSILPGYILHTSFNLAGNIVMTTGLIPYDRYFVLMSVLYPLLAFVVFLHNHQKRQ